MEVVAAIGEINENCCFGDEITFIDFEGNEYKYVNPANRGESCEDISILDPRPPIIV